MEPARLRLGALLVDARIITSQQLEQVLQVQKHDNRRLGTLLVEHGLINETQLTQILSQQLSVPWVSLYHVDFSKRLLRLVPPDIAQTYCLVPIYVRHVRGQGDTLYVAMDDPSNVEALEECARWSGLPTRAMIASPSDIRQAIKTYYSVATPSEQDARNERPAPPSVSTPGPSSQQKPSPEKNPALIAEPERAPRSEKPQPSQPRPKVSPSEDIPSVVIISEEIPPEKPQPAAHSHDQSTTEIAYTEIAYTEIDSTEIDSTEIACAVLADTEFAGTELVATELVGTDIVGDEPTDFERDTVRPADPEDVPATEKNLENDGIGDSIHEVAIDDSLLPAVDSTATPDRAQHDDEISVDVGVELPLEEVLRDQKQSDQSARPSRKTKQSNMRSLTLLDGTTVAVSAQRRRAKRSETLANALDSDRRDSNPPESQQSGITEAIQIRDILAALRSITGKADPSNAQSRCEQLEAMMATVLALLVRKQVITKEELLDEIQKLEPSNQ